jgi:hypothetical protein
VVVTELQPAGSRPAPPPPVAARPSLVGEVARFAGLLALCPLVALVEPGDVAGAVERGRALVDVERSLGVFVEPAAHAWVAARPALLAAACVFYLLVHLPATAGALLWARHARPDAYPAVRDVLVVAQVLTVVGYLLLPTAPPRLVPELGMEDTLTAFWGAGSAGAAQTVQYAYAALPSGHVVFALVAGGTVAALARRRAVRVAAGAYPLLVVAVTVVTANHYLLDAAAAGLVVAVAAALVAWPRRRRPAETGVAGT